MCGKQTVNQIGADEISMLMGTIQALKDGDTTVDELMKPIRESKEAVNHKIADIAAKAAGVDETKKKKNNLKYHHNGSSTFFRMVP